MRNGWISIAVGVLLAACSSSPAPQRPAQHGNNVAEPDSSLMRLVQLNQRMASEADHEVVGFIQADTAHQYAQCQQGAWVTRTTRVEGGEHPKMTESYHAKMKIYTLSGKLLQDIEGDYTVGNGEMPLGIEYAIRELYRGESGIIVAPWHAAFGVDGNGNIEPYMNVKIEITID